MELHRRKRVEIVVEKQLVRQVTAALRRRHEISGFTMLPCLGGAGHHGQRAPDAITDVLDNVVIVVITREEVVQPLLDELMRLLEDRIGIVAVSDVEVVRPGHF
jgi:PII-like signaling protein